MVCRLVFEPVVFLVFTLVSSVWGFCPSGCECDDAGVKVRCLGVGITMVPILLSPSLKQLYLSYNLITSISEAFEFYEWLEDLDLSHNGITTFGENNFEQQIDLRELRLSHNNVTRLSVNAFKGLFSLHFIDLSHNKLVELPPGFLSGSSKLKIILVSNNNILTVATKAFRGLRSLRVVDLCNNLLRRVPGATLEAVSASLETLQMCRNRLKGIEPDDFPTPLLKLLTLDSNFITFVDPMAFVLLGRLQKLNLNNNLLSDVPTRAFSPLLSLNSLHLSRNNISVIRETAFKGLTRLSYLEVSRSANLERVSPYAFSGCANLSTLKLSYNEKLRHLPEEFVSMLPRLRTLELRANGLETLSKNSLPWKPLQTLDVRDNPLVCNCSLKWLLQALQSRNISLIVPDVTCRAPENIQGVYLSTLPPSQLFCLNQIQIVLGVVIVTIASTLIVALGVILCRERCRISEWKRSKRKLGL